MMDKEMKREWMAWRAVCHKLLALGVDINQQDELAEAIRHWGTRLVELREHQATHAVTA